MSFIKAKSSKSLSKNRNRLKIGSHRKKTNSQGALKKTISNLSRESSRRRLRSKWVKSIDGDAMQTKGDSGNYTATVFRDSEGAKMVIDVTQGKSISDAGELIRDIDNIRSNKDQEIFNDGEILPSSIIIRGATDPKFLVDALNAALAEGNKNREQALRATLVDSDNEDGLPSFKFDLTEGDPPQKDNVPPPIPPDPEANTPPRQIPIMPAPPSQAELEAFRARRAQQKEDKLRDGASEQVTTSEKNESNQYGTLPLRPKDDSGYETVDAIKNRIEENNESQYDVVGAPLDGSNRRDQYEDVGLPLNDKDTRNQYDVADSPLTQRRPLTPPDNIYQSLRLKPKVSTDLMDAKAFKDGTKNNNLKGRTPEFKAIESAFSNYQKQLDTFSKTAQNIADVTARPAREKLTMLDQKYAIDKQISDLEKNKEMEAKFIRSQVDKLNKTLVPGEIEKIQREIDSAVQKIQTSESKLKDLNDDLNKVKQNITLKDAEINDMINAQNRFIARRQQELNETSKVLKGKIDQYLKDKVNSNNTRKLDTLAQLAQQVSDTEQNSARLTEAMESLTGIARDHQLTKPMQALDSGTASHVFVVETKGYIGASDTTQGFAKLATKEGDLANDATRNLGFEGRLLDNGGEQLNDAPNLIARQVISSRIDQALGLNVLAGEVFSKSWDGQTIGITAKADGNEMMKKAKSGDRYRKFDLTDANIQRGLSDLQIMDAITGQLDRHMGNIMIDPQSGKVTGIDNDMAFSIEGPNITVNNTLRDQFEDTGDGLIYKQTQVHEDTANAILSMTPDDFRKVLEGAPADPEHIDQKGIQHAMTRFVAVQNQVKKLKQEGKLIKQFTPQHYADAIAKGDAGNEFGKPMHSNYLAKASFKYDQAGKPDNPNIQET